MTEAAIGMFMNLLCLLGSIGICNVVRALENERPLAYLFPSSIFKQHLAPNQHMLMLGNRLTLSRRFYDKASIILPMNLELSLLHLGNSSFDSKISLKEVSSGQELVSAMRRIACVDINTHRAIRLPVEMKKSLLINTGIKGETQPVFEPVSPQSPPVLHFRHKVTVRYDDIDFLFHTNQASYARFAENCAAAATQAGFYKNFKSDICFYFVHKVDIIHMEETYVDDELEVATWQDENDRNLLYFMITKEGKRVCFLKFLYYPSQVAE